MAAEVLERVRFHVRPYEQNRGQTDKVYESGIRDIARAVVASNGTFRGSSHNILSALKRAVKALESVPVDRTSERPIIGILGEFYTVLNRWANRDLVRTLEKLGAEVRIHGLTVTNCFTLFSGHYYARNRLKEKKLKAALYYFLRHKWLMSCVRRSERCLPGRLRRSGTLDTRTILDQAAPFIYYDIDPIPASLTTRVRQWAASGVSGICNLFVLNCMIGNITVPIFKKALRGYQGLPILNAVYDGQKETNMLTRIEAFMHQARLYHERRKDRT